MPARFSPRVEAALRGLAGLPWEEDVYGVRCESACPVQAIYEMISGKTERSNNAYSHAQHDLLGSSRQWECVIDAADELSHPLRPRLLALLRGQA